MMSSLPTTLTLQSGDGTIFPVPMDVALMSELVKDKVADMQDMGIDMLVVVHNVGHDALGNLLRWCQHHRDFPYEAPMLGLPDGGPHHTALGEDVQLQLTCWDLSYFKAMNIPEFDELLWAGHYMEVKQFCDLISVVCGVSGGYMLEPPRKIQAKLLKALQDVVADQQQQLVSDTDYESDSEAESATAGDAGQLAGLTDDNDVFVDADVALAGEDEVME